MKYIYRNLSLTKRSEAQLIALGTIISNNFKIFKYQKKNIFSEEKVFWNNYGPLAYDAFICRAKKICWSFRSRLIGVAKNSL